MKRNFTVFAYVVATMAMLASCAREKEGAVDYPAVPEGEGIHVVVVGDGQVDYNETKTAAVEVDPSTTYVKWLSTDKIDVWETSVNGETASSKRFTSGAASNLTEEGGYADIKADFGVTFTGTAEGSEYFYTAVYPAGAVEKGTSGDFYFFTIPSTQNLSADGNFAENADVMIGTPIRRTERVAEGDKLAYSFSRPGTVVKLRLKGIHSGEVINSITIDAPVNITGRSKINLTTGEISDVAYYADGSLKKTQLQINGNGFTSDGDDDVWVRILSGTWTAGSSLSITVDTDKAVYTKSYENNLPKDFVFAEGGLTKFGFSFGDSNREEKSTATTYTLVTDADELCEGADYLLVGRYATKTAANNYYAVPTSITSGYYGIEKLTEGKGSAKEDETLTTVELGNTSNGSVFILGKRNGNFTFYNKNTEKYVGISGTGNANMVEDSGNSDSFGDRNEFSIAVSSTDYAATITSIKYSSRYFTANLGSTRFTSLGNIQAGQLTLLYVNLNTIKAAVAAPSVSAVAQDLATAIKVTVAPVTTDIGGNALVGANLVYTLKLTGETSIDPIVLTDADLVEGQYVKTVSGLAYGSYVVNVTVTDANGKYRSSYGEIDVELIQPELQALTISAVADAPARKITVSWTDVKDKDTESVSATSYQLYDGETPVGSAVGAGVQEAVISGESLEWGREYHLSVVASLAGYVSSVSNTVDQTVVQPQLETPNIDVEGDADERTIYVLWDEISNATHYEVYNDAVLVETIAAGTHEYTFTEITYDIDYTITVRAVNKVNTNYLPATSEAAVVNVHNPATIGDFGVLTDVDTPNSVYVTWGKAENATSYDVTLYAGSEEVVTEAGVTGTEHTFSDVDAGNTYTVCVTAKADGFDDVVKYAEGTLTVRNATISYTTVTGGTITSDPSGNAKVGTTVTLGNTPATGYELTTNSYTVNDEALAGNSFTITGDVTVSGTFQKINYTITKSGDYASNITVKKAGSVVETAQIGDVITIEAGSVSGKKFASWTVTGATPTSETASPTTFTMGAGNVTVEANYEDKTTVTYTKVTSASGIVSGGVYLVVCESLNTAMGSQNTNRRNAASVTISNNTIELEPTEVNVAGKPYEITLTKDGSIYYMRATGNYIGNNSTSNYLKETTGTTAGNQWNISYNTTTGRVVLQTNHATRRVLCVNTDNNDPYATYTSDNNYGKVTLYKKAGDTPTPPTPSDPTQLSFPTGLSWNATTKTLSWSNTNTSNGTYNTDYKYQYRLGSTGTTWVDASSVTTAVLSSLAETTTVYVRAFAINTTSYSNSAETASCECTVAGGDKTATGTSMTASTTNQYLEAGKPIKYKMSAANNFSNPLRVYQNNTLTISGATIKKIILTGSASGYPVNKLSLKSGESGKITTSTTTKVVWEFEKGTTSVTFTASAQARLDKIEVIYSE